ncbi:MAG: VWA domain-containing protein [Cyanobacteria bacterium SZAS LIN-3]|nr:VWA domain-containing protein [Cyanobacteria bacterium SZAS LIN-3]
MSTAVPLLKQNSAADAIRRCLGVIELTSSAKRIKLPLASVDIRAKVVDRIAHVTVSEVFQNPYEEAIEAVYIFPLAGGSVVSSFRLKVGERIIEGKVDERQAARKQYDQAMLEGKRAALLEQERDDVFTVQVGNLPAGEEVTVVLTYSEKLAYFDQGMTELRLPLVVAPRYIPGEALERLNVGDGVELDTDQVPDASRISPPRLLKGVNSGVALTIAVDIAAGDTIEDLVCSQHATRVGSKREGLKVALSRTDELLDRDFVLRWRVAQEEVSSNFLVYDNGYGMISLMPPAENDFVLPARDVIFVLDRSGSMQGLKMVSAARACSFLLATLGPRDRFAIQAFDTSFEWLTASGGVRFLNADEAGQEVGQKYLRTIDARGGTELRGALAEAVQVMQSRSDRSNRMPVVVVLTDGEVGNEAAIFKYIQKEIGDSRVFTVGIDTAVNDGFLRRLAALAGGTCSFVEPGAQLETALAHVGREIGCPIITDLRIEDINCGIEKDSITPVRLQDLFEGRALNAFFKLSPQKGKDTESLKVRLSGKFVDGRDFSTEIAARATDVQALPQLWAKSLVVDLEDQFRLSGGKEQTELKKRIVSIAVAHSILTKFTAFVAVDNAEVVNKDGAMRRVVQAVENPAQWAEPVDSHTWLKSIGSIGSTGANFGAANYGAANAPAPASGWGAPPSGAGWGARQLPSIGHNSFADRESGAAMPDSLAESIRQKISAQSDASSANANDSSSVPGPKRADFSSATDTGSWGAATPLQGQADGWGEAAGSEMPAALPPPQVPPAAPPAAAQEPPKAPGLLSKSKDAVRNLLNTPVSDAIMEKIFSDHFGVQPNVTAPMPANASSNTSAAAARVEGARISREQLDRLKQSFEKFDQALAVCLADIRAEKLSPSDLIAQSRLELLQLLAESRYAEKLPLLQRYLRAEILQLLAALSDLSQVTAKLKTLAARQEKKLEEIREEFSLVTSEDEAEFWHATV